MPIYQGDLRDYLLDGLKQSKMVRGTLPVSFTSSSPPVRPRWGEDDKGRDGLPWRSPGRGGRPSTTSTQYWSMRQILVLK